MSQTNALRPASFAALSTAVLMGIYSLAITVKAVIFWASRDGEVWFKAHNPAWIIGQGIDKQDAYALWLLVLSASGATLLGVVVGLLGLRGLLTRNNHPRALTSMASVTVLLFATTYASGSLMAGADFFSVDAGSRLGTISSLFNPGPGAFGLWSTLIVVLSLVLLAVQAFALISSPRSSASTAPASVPAPAPALKPIMDTPTQQRTFAALDGYFYTQVDGVEYGPYRASEIAQWADEGRIVPTSLLRPEGGYFERASLAPGLFD